MNLLIRIPYTVLQLLSLVLCWVVAWIVQELAKLVMLALGFSKHQKATVCSRIFRSLNFLVMDVLNPFWSIRVVRPIPAGIAPGEKYIVMINHLSNADPWLLLRLFVTRYDLRDWKFVSKGSLFRVPFGGWGLRNNGDLEVKFTKEKGGWGTEKGSVKVLLDDAAETIESGSAVAIFPEGVRNPAPAGPVGEFKQGFFDLAVANGYKILPVAISGAEFCWPVRDWKLDAATVFVSSGDLISPAGHTGESLKNAVHAKISAMRELHSDRKSRN